MGFIFLLLTSLVQANHLEFKGSFSQVNASEFLCSDFFKEKNYTAKFFLVGPTGHSAVLYLESKEKTGAFHGVNQVGLYGASNDFKVDKKFKDGDKTIEFVAEGIVDYGFILFKQTVKVLSADNKVLCDGEAEYSAFH